MRWFRRKTEEEKRIARARKAGQRVKRTSFPAEYRPEVDARMVREIDQVETDMNEEQR